MLVLAFSDPDRYVARYSRGVPDDRQLIGVVGLGHEGVDERPRGSAYSLSRRPLDEMVHRNRW